MTVCESVDRAAVGGATGTGGTPTPGAATRKPSTDTTRKTTPSKLTAGAKRRGKRVTVSGKLTLPKGVAASACKGAEVRLTIRSGRKVAGRGTARLDGRCAYKATIKVSRTSSLKVSARFAGTGTLAALGGRPTAVR